MAAITFLALCSLGLSGCIPIQIIPGATADENIWLFGSSSSSTTTISCESTHRVRLNLRTSRGWVSVHHTKRRCDDESRSFDRWRVTGFREDRPLTDSVPHTVCDPCSLDFEVEEGSGEVEDIRVVFFEPAWMRILVKRGGDWQAWDAVVTDHSDPSQVKTAMCDEHREPEAEGAYRPPELSSCFSRIGDGYLGPPARELEDPLFFDELVLNWMADHSDDMSKVVAGLRHFMETHRLSGFSSWESGQEMRPASTRASIGEVIEETDCADVVEAGGGLWSDYIEVLEEALEEPQRRSAVNACLGAVARLRPEALEEVDEPFSDQDITYRFDEAMEALAPSDEEVPLDLWLTRMDAEPQPSVAITAEMDRRIIERFPEGRDHLERRLRHEQALSSENQELLLDKVWAHDFDDPDFLRWVYEHRGMEAHVDGLDEALIAALEEGEVALDVFEQRAGLLAIYPMSARNRGQLKDLLVALGDDGADEAMAFVLGVEASVGEALIARLDQRFVEDFPDGGEFFFMRLSHDDLPRPTPAVREGVLDRAREFKERGEEVDRGACQSVRLLNAMSATTGRCTLPDHL